MKFAAFKELTRLEHSLFALPFVLSGALLALPNISAASNWIYIVPAFFFARISGMAFNQLIDRHIDAKNPRTKSRALPTGRVTVTQARWIAWGALALFLIVTLPLGVLTTCFALVAAFLIAIYSYMKRLHYTCHFVLGTIHFFGPVLAYTVLTGYVSPPVLYLGAAAFFLIAGSDIVYALQDYEFDCTHQLCSLPARFGVEKSLLAAAGLHIVCLCMLLAVGLSAHLPIFYYLLLPIVAVIFFDFHKKLRSSNVLEIDATFFVCTVAVSFSSLVFIVVSVLWDAIL